MQYAQGLLGNMQLLFGVDCVADDLIGRLTCASLFYDAGYGTDVDLLTNSAQNLGAAVKAMEKEVLKDDRVQQARASYSFDATGTLTVVVSVTLSGGETFALVGTPASQLPPGSLVFQVQR